MSKTITTRIKNKIDDYQNWTGSTGTLLDGEIAIVRVTTEEVTPAGEVVHKPALLMKVGDGSSSFADLPWLSAKASDVYAWAKTSEAKNIPLGKDASGNDVTLSKYLNQVDTNTGSIAANAEAIVHLNAAYTDDKSVAYKIKTALAALASNENNIEGEGTFVTTVTQEDGKIAVQRTKISIDDLPDINWTNINADNGNLQDVIGELEGQISSINTAIAGGVHFIGITTTELTDGSTTSAVLIEDKSNDNRVNGDVVIYNDREFIWTGSAWCELGDLSRVGAIETQLTGLSESSLHTGKFVTHFVLSDGELIPQTATPDAANITYTANSTVAEGIAANTAAIASHTHGNIDKDGKLSEIDRVVVTSSDGAVNVSDITTTELGHLAGVTSNIQTQLNGKAASDHGTHVEYGGDGKATTVSRSDHTHGDYEAAISGIQGNYVRFDKTSNKLFVGTEGTEEIIFSCGGAPNA